MTGVSAALTSGLGVILGLVILGLLMLLGSNLYLGWRIKQERRASAAREAAEREAAERAKRALAAERLYADPAPWACPVCAEAGEPLIRAETQPGDWHHKRHRFLFGGWRAWQVCPACGATGASGTGWTLEAALGEARRQTMGAQNRARSVAEREAAKGGGDGG